MHGHTIHTVTVTNPDGTVTSKHATEEVVLKLAQEAEGLWPPSPAARLAHLEKVLGVHQWVSPLGKVYKHDPDTHELVHHPEIDPYAVTAGEHAASNMVTIDAAVFNQLLEDVKQLKAKLNGAPKN